MFAKLRKIPTLTSKTKDRQWYYKGRFENFEGEDVKLSNKKGTYFARYKYPLNSLFDIEDKIKVVNGIAKGVVDQRYIRKRR